MFKFKLHKAYYGKFFLAICLFFSDKAFSVDFDINTILDSIESIEPITEFRDLVKDASNLPNATKEDSGMDCSICKLV